METMYDGGLLLSVHWIRMVMEDMYNGGLPLSVHWIWMVMEEHVQWWSSSFRQPQGPRRCYVRHPDLVWVCRIGIHLSLERTLMMSLTTNKTSGRMEIPTIDEHEYGDENWKDSDSSPDYHLLPSTASAFTSTSITRASIRKISEPRRIVFERAQHENKLAPMGTKHESLAGTNPGAGICGRLWRKRWTQKTRSRGRSETVFSPHSIIELDLSTCRVAPNTWNDLGKYARSETRFFHGVPTFTTLHI